MKSEPRTSTYTEAGAKTNAGARPRARFMRQPEECSLIREQRGEEGGARTSENVSMIEGKDLG